jgi:NodT family efflux transporter outer membrane factor (OMF) lipoprotein
LQQRLRYARENAVSQRETLDIVIAREDAGLVPLLDVSQARTNLAITESSIPRLEAALERARNRLAVLLGQAPGSLDEMLEQDSVIPAPSTDVALALPAELLRRRPDVRRSERNIAAQTAQIGVATAALYPSFSLSGDLILEATDFGDLDRNESFGWSLVPGMQWSLFTGGKVRGLIQAEEARTAQAVAEYEKTVLNALAEVENSLVALRQEEMRQDLLQTAVTSAQQSVELVHTQYIEGLTDFQNYLDSQRALFNQQDQLATSRGQVVKNLVFLNRAMGGGWSLEEGPQVESRDDLAVQGDSEPAGESGEGE